MKLTTIQVEEEVRKRLLESKKHSRESYNAVIKRLLELESIPPMDEMFAIGDSLPEEKRFTTKEVIALCHELRGRE